MKEESVEQKTSIFIEKNIENANGAKKLIVRIKDAVKLDNIILKKHALVRMLERRIQSDEIIEAILSSVIVEEYYDDKPFPSCLVLGYSKNRPLHIVVSYDLEYKMVYVITIYEPSVELWSSDFKTKRRKT